MKALKRRSMEARTDIDSESRNLNRAEFSSGDYSFKTSAN